MIEECACHLQLNYPLIFLGGIITGAIFLSITGMMFPRLFKFIINRHPEQK